MQCGILNRTEASLLSRFLAAGTADGDTKSNQQKEGQQANRHNAEWIIKISPGASTRFRADGVMGGESLLLEQIWLGPGSQELALHRD